MLPSIAASKYFVPSPPKAVPSGYVIGSSLAYTLLGEPLPILQPEPRRIVALVATALAAMLLVYVDAMRHRIHNEAAARMEAQRLATEAELRLLHAQLELHMLRPTTSSRSMRSSARPSTTC